MGRDGTGRTRVPAGPAVGGIASVLVAAVCLRPALTAVGPVLELIGSDTGLSNTMLGLLSALPLLAFAAVSPLVSGPARRLGIERTVAAALAVLAVGAVLRLLPGLPALFAGTLAAGAGIAVGNVLIPVVVRRDNPARIPLMTGLYSATMGTAAALASGVSLPPRPPWSGPAAAPVRTRPIRRPRRSTLPPGGGGRCGGRGSRGG